RAGGRRGDQRAPSCAGEGALPVPALATRPAGAPGRAPSAPRRNLSKNHLRRKGPRPSVADELDVVDPDVVVDVPGLELELEAEQAGRIDVGRPRRAPAGLLGHGAPADGELGPGGGQRQVVAEVVVTGRADAAHGIGVAI